MKLSIVVPVYNVDKYLERCLDSLKLIGIPPEEYEVIVVDDGSTDSSSRIIESYEWQRVNHKIYTQPNKGLSSARNAGLDLSSGEYVWFVDSDDWIEQDCKNNFFSELSDCDILAFSSYLQFKENEWTCLSMQLEEDNGHNFSCNPFFHGAPFYIFRRNFLLENKLSFHPGIYYEDSHFTPRALYLASYVKVFKAPIYCNRLRRGSITRSDFSFKKKESFEVVIIELNSFRDSQVAEEYRDKWSSVIADVINNYAKEAYLSSDISLKKQAAVFLNDSNNIAALKCARKPFSRLWYYLGCFSGGKFYEVYAFLFRLRYMFERNND